MTVLIAYAPDPSGEAALDAGLAEAARDGEEVLVVNATKGDALVDRRYAGDEQVAEVQRRITQAGLVGDVHQAVAADVGDEVVAQAERSHARLIVVGIRHRSPVGKAIMGSVAQRVILDARVPVLCVKTA